MSAEWLQPSKSEDNPSCVVVGVSGGSGSGKTTFCRELVEWVGPENVVHFKQDNYYRDLSHMTPEQRDSVNFDHPSALDFKLLCEHLTGITNGHAVEIPTYDFASHTRRVHTVQLTPKPIVLLEGILIFSQPEILELLSHSIFVEAPEPLRLERRIKRDVAERGRTPESVELQFYSTVAPMHELFVEPTKVCADKVVSGEKPFDEPIRDLLTSLKMSHLRRSQ
jgi:uridine kinase